MTEVFFIGLGSTQREAVEKLEHELEKHKTTLSQAFIGQVPKVLLGQDDEHLLRKLLPPQSSRFHGKATCHDGTRQSIIRTVDLWTNGTPTRGNADTSQASAIPESSRLFWLYGVAGCGKSTVAASVCAQLAWTHRLAGSFFCKRDEDERRDGVRLFWAIAFYLAQINTAYREKLLDCLRKHETLLDYDIITQVDRLLINPLRDADHNHESQPPAIIVIDALDECNDVESVARHLVYILMVASSLRLIITSRDLPEIRVSLAPLGSLKKQHDLFEDDARKDIAVYLRSQFLPNKSLAELNGHVTEKEIAALAAKSEGLFIWMYTVVRFIANMGVGKLLQFKRLLKLDGAVEAESALDTIY